MPPIKNYKTPGVYSRELDAFPPSVVGVQTAVPAFIGYTETAHRNGAPVSLKPVEINSLVDFEAIFGGADSSRFKLTELAVDAKNPPDVTLGATNYTVDFANATPQHYLYNSMRLYYANGGGHCFVVSVGDYSSGAKKADFLSGLSSLANQVGPTILVIPSACLLNEDEYADVVQAMLTQCEQLQDRVAIIDVRGGDKIQPDGLDILINGAAPKKGFRDYVKGEQNQLSYGMAYFPFLFTSIVQPNELGLRNLNDASRALTKKWLTEELPKQYPNVSAGKGAELAAELGIIDQVKDGDIIAPGVTDIAIQLSNNLLAAFPQLGQLYEVMAKKLNVLPPSGAMAGVYAAVDKTRGVWNAPANITLNAVVGPTVKISGDEQDDLNVPVGGKAVNVIREFVGRGTLVWGARTLNGNSSDWRYIQVRRTMIYVQQSIKAALQPYVFAANDGKTWSTVTAMISNFLQTLWSQGGLMGDKASEAFTVHCGLGTTMTGQDILDGYMIVQVSLQMIHPAEFIEVTFKQQMQGVA